MQQFSWKKHIFFGNKDNSLLLGIYFRLKFDFVKVLVYFSIWHGNAYFLNDYIGIQVCVLCVMLYVMCLNSFY